MQIDASTILVERYDEIVFPKPSNLLRSFLESESGREANKFRTDFDEMERDAVEALEEGQRRAEEEIREVSGRKEEVMRKIAILQSAWEAHQLEKTNKSDLELK